MNDEKLLFQLEYEVGKLRNKVLRQIESDNLTLRQVLEFGLDKTILNGYTLYIDVLNGDKKGFLIDGYYLDDEDILNAIVQYENDEIYVDLYEQTYDYLQVKVSFKDKKYTDKLYDYMEKQYKKEQQKDDEIPQE